MYDFAQTYLLPWFLASCCAIGLYVWIMWGHKDR